jgi:hypothetical protein
MLKNDQSIHLIIFSIFKNDVVFINSILFFAHERYKKINWFIFSNFIECSLLPTKIYVVLSQTLILLINNNNNHFYDPYSNVTITSSGNRSNRYWKLKSLITVTLLHFGLVSLVWIGRSHCYGLVWKSTASFSLGQGFFTFHQLHNIFWWGAERSWRE